MMKYVAICLIALIGAAFAVTSEHHAEFAEWQHTHGIFFGDVDEYAFRLQVFSDNKAEVARLNALNDGATYALNKHAHLTKDEFSLYYLGMKPTNKAPVENLHKATRSSHPDHVDWRELNMVTPVKNQGMCGSCWTFSTIGSIESAWAIAGNPLVSLSEEQIKDCSWGYFDVFHKQSNQGCNGGLITPAFNYILEIGGKLVNQKDYPYVPQDLSRPAPHGCRFNTTEEMPVAAVMRGYMNVVSGSEDSLMDAIANYGPVSVAVNAEKFRFYQSGVMGAVNCPGDFDSLNHGVVAVGYGEIEGKSVYYIKNSWGPDWGDRGYMYMERTEDNKNICGIASLASFPLV